MRVLGLDPGLTVTGWGIVDVAGNRLAHVGHGTIVPDPRLAVAERLCALERGLGDVIRAHVPAEAAVEEVFVARNPTSAIKLGMARGVILAAASGAGLTVAEYAARFVKKAIVGSGAAEKAQMVAMVCRLLPGVAIEQEDAADALAVAICHAHDTASRRRWAAEGIPA